MNCRKLLCNLILPAFFLLLSNALWAQTKTVTGQVTDANGVGVAGVSVTARGSNSGTSTSTDGSFNITVPSTATTLVFSSVGYATQEVAIGAQNTVNVRMQTAAGNLNEVVVVGYGTQRRRDVTGAIAKVTSEKITALPTPSFEASLQGRVAGVQVSQSSGLSGAASYVRIRGIASVSAGGDPLYVIDGIPVTSDVFTYANGAGGDEWRIRQGFSQNPLASINPNDIESIEILKDAGAAGIYGSRGANGVILVTTKRGKTGKPQFNFSSKVGFSSPSVKPDFVSSAEWIQLRQEAWENDGYTGLAPLPSNLSREDALKTNTNWFDEVTRTGILQDYNFSVTAGSKRVKYFGGASYNNDQSYAVGNEFKRYGVRNNFDFNITNTFKASVNTSWNRGVNYRIPSGWGGGIGAALSNALPFYKVYDDNGEYWYAAGRGNNPLMQINETKWRSVDNRLLGGLALDFTPIKNLSLRATGNYDYLNNNQDRFESMLYRSSDAESRRFTLDVHNYNVNATATYNYNVNANNRLTFLLGSEYQRSLTKAENFYLNSVALTQPFWKDKKSFDTANVYYPNGNAQGEDRKIANRSAFISYFTRINYNFKDKLSLQALARVDGSSKFGPNNRYGFFPAMSAAYVLSEEKFFNDAFPFANYFKLRASYGITGNANIPDFEFLDNWQYTTTGNDLYNGQPILYPTKYPNEGLKWEELHNFDAGLEFGLFRNILSGEIGYYNKQTKDVLMIQRLSESNGRDEDVYKNLGEVKNEGIELSLNGRLIQKRDLNWNVNFNISHNYNVVTDVQGLSPDAIRSGTNETRVIEGYPLGTSYTIVYVGVDPADGLPIYLDGQGKQTKVFPNLETARRPAGKLIPDWTGGFGTNIKYKGFEVNTLFAFATGLNIWDNSGKNQFQGVSSQNWNYRREFLDRWTVPGDISRYPRLYYNKLFPGLSSQDAFSSTLFLFEGDYLRMRELTLAYTFSGKTLQNTFLRNARVYLTGMNLFLWTKYHGDPEVNRDADGGTTDRNMSPNVNYLTPPQAKSVMLGLNINF